MPGEPWVKITRFISHDGSLPQRMTGYVQIPKCLPRFIQYFERNDGGELDIDDGHRESGKWDEKAYDGVTAYQSAWPHLDHPADPYYVLCEMELEPALPIGQKEDFGVEVVYNTSWD
tara:strand:+ start:300 stop:650 length:351 start_codon:yes stop_codon:yes gene_type:complete